MNRKLSFALAMLIANVAGGQHLVRTQDSLLYLTQRTDTTQVLAFLELSKLFVSKNPDSALLFARKGYFHASRLKFESAFATADLRIGNAYFRKGKFDSAEFYYQKALVAAEKTGDNTVRMSALTNQVSILLQKNENDKAIERLLYLKSLLGDPQYLWQKIICYGNLAIANERNGNFVAAIAYYDTARSLNSTRPEKFRAEKLDYEVSSLFNVGNIYLAVGDLDRAAEFYQKGITKGGQEVIRPIAVSLQNLGNVYLARGKYDSALLIFDKAIELKNRVGTQVFLANTWGYRALAQIKLGRLDDARYSLSKANELMPLVLDQRLPPVLAHIEGQYLFSRGQFEEANKVLKHSIELAIKAGDLDTKTKSNYTLYKSYREEKKFANALRALEEFIQDRDSLWNSEKRNVIARTENRFMLSQQAKDNAKLKKQAVLAQELADSNARQRNLIIAVCTLLFLLLALAFISLRRFKKINSILSDRNTTIDRQNDTIIKKNNELEASRKQLENYNEKLVAAVDERTRELALRNRQLEESIDQIEQFSFMTAHNLRGPLARIKGLMALFDDVNLGNSDNVLVVGKLKDSVKELDEVIADISFLVQIQRQSDAALHRLTVSSIVHKITERFRGELDTLGARLELTGDDYLYSNAEHLESIFENLISNSIKYCEPRRPLEIGIYVKLNESKASIIYFDNGIGFDTDDFGGKLFKPFQKFHESSSGKGMGLFLIKTRVVALGGEIFVKGFKDKGLQYQIVIPQ